MIEINDIKNDGAERAVLGAMLLDKYVIDQNLDRLNSKMFSNPKNQKVFDSIMSLYSDGYDVDAVSVKNKLTGGPNDGDISSYVSQLMDSIGSATSADFYIDRIEHCYLKREAAVLLNRAESEIGGIELNDIEAWLIKQQDLFSSVGQKKRAKEVDMSKLLDSAYKSIIDAKLGKVTGYDWPLEEVTKATRGIVPGKTYAIGGLKKSGKTRWLANTFFNLAQSGVDVMLFSLEMTKETIIEWLIAWYCEIDTKELGTTYIQPMDMALVEEKAQVVEEVCR